MSDDGIHVHDERHGCIRRTSNLAVGATAIFDTAVPGLARVRGSEPASADAYVGPRGV